MRAIILTLIGVGLFLNCNGQNKMKQKEKFLKDETTVDNYIKEHKGRLTNNEVLLGYSEAPERKEYVWYYEFEDGSLLFVVKNLNGKDGTVYPDKDAYVQNMLEIREWNKRTTLDKHQDIIQNLLPHIPALLDELFTKLKLESVQLQDVDLEKMDKAIKKYGYKKTYEDLYLHLIVFGGEYAKAKVGGYWTTERSEKNELVPIFVDGKNRKLKFDFWIRKDLAKKGKFTMSVIIDVELHGPLPVHPNPSLRNPNNQ